MPNAVLAFVLLAASAGPEPIVKDRIPPGHSADFSRARPGAEAAREEFEAARRANTTEAWDRFIARHPGDPLAEEARRARALLARNP